MGGSGIGEVSGDRYRVVGVNQRIHIEGRVGSTETHVTTFGLIGPGPGNNLVGHLVYHITVNANGTVTALVEISRVECT